MPKVCADRIIMFSVIGLVAWGIVVLPFLYGTPPPLAEFGSPPQVHLGQFAQESVNKPDGSENAPFFIKILKTAGETAQEAEDRRDKASTDRWLMIFTGAVAFFTLLLVGATVLLYRAGEKQRASSERIAEAANRLNRENSNASRRAWLTIEDVKLKHPTKFSEDGFVFGVDVTTKNLGQTPATSIEIRCESYFAQNGSEKYTEAKNRFTAMMRSQPVELGHMLFPHDTLIQGETWADGPEKIKGAITTQQSGERKLGFMIFVGISYRIVGDPTPHITYHAYGMLNVPIGTAILSGQFMDLPPEPFLAGEAD